ncbi:MAG: glycosyltransferase [Chloroflexota bacterium]|nr:glycosyltransferase [Chloroflexota bacterium]
MSDHLELVAPGDRLRIAVLGDFDGVHTRSWLRWFIDRGHDIHAISYYPPAAAIDGATLHVLRAPRASGAPSKPRPHAAGGPSRMEDRLPRGLIRIAHALRYRRAGLARVVRRIAPDVLHGHFVVEHGFYGTMAAFHPYVVTAWGSDILVEPDRDPISRMIARWTLRRADLLTSNNAYMSQSMIALGVPKPKVELITLGADRYDLAAYDSSLNVRNDAPSAPTIISTRAHEPLYNIGEIIDAYGRVARTHTDARLVIAHSGSQTVALQRRAAAAGGRIEFAGRLDSAAFRDALSQAHIFVSVPSSDGTSVALLQAMAAGCFPIVSDLATQREWIEHGVNGFRVPLHRPDLLAAQVARALGDAPLRQTAARRNRELVEARGLNEHEMPKMEALYGRLAGRRA